MAVVFDVPKSPTGEVFDAGTPVVIELVAALDSAGGPIPGAPGYHVSSQETVFKRSTTTIDTDGKWSADLIPNADLEPSNTYYRAFPPGRQRGEVPPQTFVVPPGSGPFWIFDLLISPPDSLLPPSPSRLPQKARTRTEPLFSGGVLLLTSTTWHDLDQTPNSGPAPGLFDLALPASVGDVVGWSFSGTHAHSGIPPVEHWVTVLDVVSLDDTDAPIADFGGGGAEGLGPDAGFGVGAWSSFAIDDVSGTSLTKVAFGGEVRRAVAADEIINGQLRCRPRFRLADPTGTLTTPARIIYAMPGLPLSWSMTNYGKEAA